MCRRNIWRNTYNLFGVDRLEEWTYCPNSIDDQPCRRIYIHDHGDINMAPDRPRSAGFDIPFGPRIIERKPEAEVRELPIPKTEGRSKRLTIGFKFRDLFNPIKVEKIQPRPILRRPEPAFVQPEYVEMREPRRPRPPTNDFVPLSPPLLSPRRLPEPDIPIEELRSPRRSPIIHSPPSPYREHRRRRARSPSPNPVREVETIRVRRLDKTDRGKAERQRARNAEEEARFERERRLNLEDANRHLTDIALRERSQRHRLEREAQNADVQRRSAEIAAADLQRENDRLELQRRLVEREAAVLELEREREREEERERARDALRYPQDLFRPARDILRQTREAPRSTTDRGAEVIRAAQDANRRRRGERISYYANGRRIDPDRYD